MEMGKQMIMGLMVKANKVTTLYHLTSFILTLMFSAMIPTAKGSINVPFDFPVGRGLSDFVRFPRNKCDWSRVGSVCILHCIGTHLRELLAVVVYGCLCRV